VEGINITIFIANAEVVLHRGEITMKWNSAGTPGIVCSLVALALVALPASAGADDVEQAVAAQRGKTKLAQLAAAMKPGTWAELPTEMPKGLWTSPPPSRGLHIAGWTDDAHWDSRTGQFLYMGIRQTRQFIAFSEETNVWRVIPLDKEGDNPVFQTKFGHIYGTNAFDPENSRLYHLHRDFESLKGGISFFDTGTQKWTKLPPRPLKSGGMSIEYFSARKGLLVLGSQLWFFSDERQQWEDLGKCPIDGYHSLMRHNPYRNEVLMAGGNNARRIVARLKKDGPLELLKELPVDLGIRSDKLTVDPVSGRYLIMQRDKQFYEFDSDKNEYRLIDDFTKTPWPFGRYDMPVVAFIPEYGVTMWVGTSKVWLYKHDAGN